MQKNLLEAEIKKNGETAGVLAKHLGISSASFSKKINGKSEFVQSEIAKIKEVYSLTAEQVDEIFFKQKVS